VESGNAAGVEKLSLTPSHGAPRRPDGAPRLGDILIAEGLATADQVQDALRLQRQSKTYVPLGHVLVRQRIITRRQLASVLERHQRSSKIGELLVKTGALTAEQLSTALAEQRRWKRPFGEVVVRLRFVTEEQLRKALCLQLHINYFDLDTITLDRSLRALINPRFARKLCVVPVARVGHKLVVAMDDPTRTLVVDDLEASTGLDIEVITSTTAAIRRALDQMYPGETSPVSSKPRLDATEYEALRIVGEPHVLSFEEMDRPAEEQTNYLDQRGLEPTSSVVRKLLSLAVDRGASDIHLEAVDRRIKTRFRIDGVLQELDGDSLDELLNVKSGMDRNTESRNRYAARQQYLHGAGRPAARYQPT